MISANQNDDTISILLNDGSGVFTLDSSPAVSHFSDALVAVDINGDGYADLVCGSQLPGNLSVLTNDGWGGFSLSQIFPMTNPLTIISSDVNDDGKTDLVVADPFHYDYGNIIVVTNNGTGIFSYSGGIGYNGLTAAVSVAAGDVNGDGKLELITANYYNNTFYELNGDGSGSFNFSASFPASTGPACVKLADVNGDNKLDIITANFGTNTLSVLTNNGSGGFVLASTSVVGSAPYFVILADVNGDGRLDLISANSGTNTLSVLTNALNFMPRLAVKRTTSSVVVSWPSSWTGWAGWTLQQNTNLNNPNWTSFNDIIGDDGTTKTATNSPPFGNRFFRLAHP